ncbi:MAG: hypothetical protein JXQ87_18420 [Bacteroidia bacterium]
MSEQESLIKISKGPTLKLGLLGLLVIIGSGVFTYFYSLIPAIPTFYLGLVALLSIEGVVIDLQNQKLQSYFSFLFFRVGSWKSLDIYKKLVLTVYSESSTYTLRATQTTTRTKSFDVCLVDSMGKLQIVDEYGNYYEALEFAEELAEQLNLPFEDQFAEMQESIAERRAGRR